MRLPPKRAPHAMCKNPTTAAVTAPAHGNALHRRVTLHDRAAIVTILRDMCAHRWWTTISCAGRGPQVLAQGLPIRPANLVRVP